MIKLSYPQFWQTNSLLSWLLLPISLVYRLLGMLRRIIVTPQFLPAKVICIGNATVGGTGKTQVAIWLTKKLIAEGLKPVILCKGYGGSFKSPMIVTKDMDASLVGDEALELCEYAATIVARKPTQAIALLKDLSPDIIIVDDGMQNPSFIKDFVIMVVDGKRGFGNRRLFPAGPMRQSVESGLEMAGSLVVTRYMNEDGIIDIEGDNVYRATILPETSLKSDRKYYAFTGIGNPERFFELCKNHLRSLVGAKAFPDHHIYSNVEILELQKEAAKLGAQLITTRKDYVKLRSYQDIMSLNVTLEIEEEDKLIDSLGLDHKAKA